MQFNEFISKAKEVHEVLLRYEKNTLGKTWTKSNIVEGFVGDVGDLMKLVMAKEGLRKINDVDKKLSHELSDCLWSIIILAELYDIDLEKSYMRTMREIKMHVKNKDARNR